MQNFKNTKRIVSAMSVSLFFVSAHVSGAEQPQQAVQEKAQQKMQKQVEKIDKAAQSWWLQIFVQSQDGTNMLDKTNYIGEHEEASDQQDSRDLQEMAPFQKPFLSLYFPKDWGDGIENYSSDFRALAKQQQSQRKWQFVVESDEKRDIKLYWQASDTAQLQAMHLYDVANEKTIPAKKVDGGVNEYEVKMSAEKMHFHWLLKPPAQ